jgi:signal transduction histidine kinase
MMPISERFLALLNFQLSQFSDCEEVRSLVVYVTHQSETGEPTLMPVGHWPMDSRALPSLGVDSQLRMPSEERRWLPLRDQNALLGALQVESDIGAWPEPLRQRLQGVALCLTEALRLDLERQALQRRLDSQEDQLRTLVHQLRNPLTALRTFGQLLRRRLSSDSDSRNLVDGLLEEQRQLNRYVDAISDLARPDTLLPAPPSPQPLLLPPLLSRPGGDPLGDALHPLLQRATATAALQGRPWRGPDALPDWRGDSGAVAEILANLLENAFRYAPPGAAVGLHTDLDQGELRLTVWDGGTPIPLQEREAIFERGRRGSTGERMPGTGLGLALARELARGLGGDLKLLIPPSAIAPDLPNLGNAFQLSLPRRQRRP